MDTKQEIDCKTQHAGAENHSEQRARSKVGQHGADRRSHHHPDRQPFSRPKSTEPRLAWLPVERIEMKMIDASEVPTATCAV